MNNVEKVNIDKLIKADWNYKTDGTDEQINKLINSIKYDNSAGVLAVRELGDKLEVIDGNHRLEALRRMNMQEVQVENFGALSKAKAILVARRRNHVWFDDDLLSFSELLKNDVLPEIALDDIKNILPDSTAEIDNMLALGKFDWEEPTLNEPKDNDGNKVIKVKVTEEVFKMWQEWVQFCAEQNNFKSESEAFEFAIVEAKNGQNSNRV
jgi:hypothetical protein